MDYPCNLKLQTSPTNGEKMIKYQTPNQNELIIRRAGKLLDMVRDKLRNGELTGPDEYVAEMYESFKALFSGLRKPLLSSFEIDEKSIRDPEEYRRFLVNLEADLETIIKVSKDTTDASVATFNLAAVKGGILDVLVGKANSMSADLQLLDTELGNSVMVAGDDFTNQERIAGGSCDLMPGGLGVSLQRTSVVNVATQDNAKVEINREEDDELYEGRFYAPLGKADPEGGKFKWKQEHKTSSRSLNVPKERMWFVPGDTSEEDLQTERKKILDSNPDTYWQIEKTSRPYALRKWQEDREQADLETPQSITAEQLAEKVASFDDSDLEVAVTVVLDEPKRASFISLVPLNFYEGNYLEILSVATAPSDDAEFEVVPNISNNESILTPEANEDLQEDEVAAVLSDTKAFAGQGLWVFPERVIKKVEVVLRNTIPIPTPYSVFRVTYEGDKVTTTKKTKKTKKYGVVKRRTTTTTSTEHIVQKEDLNYIRSVMLKEGDIAKAPLAPGLVTPETGKEGFSGRTRGNSLNSSKTYGNTTVEFGDWSVSDKVEVPKYDIVRYAIGIRDLNIASYTYADSSELISVPYEFPYPIEKIALAANERFPGELSTDDATEPWIKYYISFDGNKWIQLAPIDTVGMNLMNEGIPKIININSDLPAEARNPIEGYIETKKDVFKVMFKAEMRRPGDNEKVSPVLNSYRLRAVLRGSL